MHSILRNFVRPSLCALALAGAALGTQAAVLSTQAPVDAGTAVSGTYSIVEEFGFQNAESFTLGGPATVTGFRWWGSDAGNTSDFVVRLFANPLTDSDAFTTLSGSIGQTATTLTDDGGTLAIYQFDLTLDTALSAAISGSYLSVFLNNSALDWYWLEGGGGDGSAAFRGMDNDFWTTGAPDLSLAVIGERDAPTTVPEPGVLALLALAALAAAAARRHSRR